MILCLTEQKRTGSEKIDKRTVTKFGLFDLSWLSFFALAFRFVWVFRSNHLLRYFGCFLFRSASLAQTLADCVNKLETTHARIDRFRAFD
jgi:hypothetical protein